MDRTETFEQFMDRCLHDPAKGYYARNISGIGPRGDFTTAPTLSSSPAEAIAGWAAAAMRRTRCRNLIEIGPGTGTLSRDILQRLPLLLRLRTKLHLVESSPVLAQKQKQLLGKRATHHRHIQGAIQACEGNAVIFSNELVDAFPVRLFELGADEWMEIGIDSSGGALREVRCPVAELPPSSAFHQGFSPGQRVEVHDSYRHWLEAWLPTWKRGEMLTIDYGDAAERLYESRPHGTLRAYLLHERLVGSAIYQNPGLQDLTADVNFTDLCEWSAPWLESDPIESFADFLSLHSRLPEPRLLEAADHFRAIVQRPSCGTH